MILMAQIGGFESFLVLLSLSSFLYFGLVELKYLYGGGEERLGIWRAGREMATDKINSVSEDENENENEMYRNDKLSDKQLCL